METIATWHPRRFYSSSPFPFPSAGELSWVVRSRLVKLATVVTQVRAVFQRDRFTIVPKAGDHAIVLVLLTVTHAPLGITGVSIIPCSQPSRRYNNQRLKPDDDCCAYSRFGGVSDLAVCVGTISFQALCVLVTFNLVTTSKSTGQVI